MTFAPNSCFKPLRSAKGGRRRWLQTLAKLGLLTSTAVALGPMVACRAQVQRDSDAGTAAATRTDDAPAAAADWHLVADFDTTAALWLSYDAGHEALTLALVQALQHQVPLVCVVQNEAAQLQMQALLRQRGLSAQGLRYVVQPQVTFFVRDLLVFARRPQGAAVLDFAWSEYGVAAWCAQRHGTGSADAASCAAHVDLSRESVDRAVAQQLGLPVWRSSIAIEGGGLESNGRGLVIANEALYLSRNPGRSRTELDEALRRLPGVRRVIWLPAGLAEDPLLRASITPEHVAWGTGGHTDEFVRFADARTVLLAWPEDADVVSHPVARLTRQRMQQNWDILSRASDADGVPLRLLKVPMPRPIERRVFLSAVANHPRAKDWSADHFAPHEGRWQGQPVLQVATASWLNFVLANQMLVLPDFVPHGTPRAQQERARRVFEQALPGRQIRFVDAITAHWVGGGLHCATLNQPPL